MSEQITTTLDAHGVLVATIDMPGLTMNVFSVELMDALDALMDRVEQDPAVRSCVVTSGKPSFLAGADLVMVRGYTDQAKTATHDEMFATCGRLGRQFVRLEASAKPWVAAVNGIALGGGLELSLACRVRLTTDDPKSQLGVPEIRWGLLPGAGGTQRLPRLTAFGPAMDLLLSGRSMDPATAVRLGIFAKAVPAAALLDEAKAVARSMHGTALDLKAKYANLAQADVPAWSDDTAQAIAAANGIDAETYRLYPAYSAIVDSVLKGAHQPLAEATTIEMNQFLRLMFSPVAGRMVRTLFLERLRAERELAPPAGVRIERLEAGAIGSGRAAWQAALGKLKLPQTANDTLPADTLDLIDTGGARHRVALRVLDDAPEALAGTAMVLCPAGPYGRVIEITGGPGPAADAAAALATRLWALPWRSPGHNSVLQALRGGSLDEQAVVALCAIALPGAGEPAFLDAAACMAGLTPAWTGGPLVRLWDERERLRTGFDADTTAAWAAAEGTLARAAV